MNGGTSNPALAVNETLVSCWKESSYVTGRKTKKWHLKLHFAEKSDAHVYSLLFKES